jgi:hypothetical protein
MGCDQEPVARFQEFGKLPDVGGVGRHRKASETLLDLQVIDEALQGGLVRC